MIFAEVIGDPIAQSKSPIIHKHWLEQLGIQANYRKTLVRSEELAQFAIRRRGEPNWSGCNVTIPHKVSIIPLLDEIAPAAAQIGAVNCVERKVSCLTDKLIGHNTDVEGIAASLDSTDLEGREVALIGAGGGARALISYLARRRVGRVSILVRDPGKAAPLREQAGGVDLEILPLDQAEDAFDGAAAIVNASPLGMAGAAEMPTALLEAVGRNAAGATIFDMVTTPAETALLAVGRIQGAQVVDGLTMLIGQARRAFEIFFGHPAPPPDQQLRDLLVT